MKLFMFSVFDRASKVFAKPFCDVSEASASRALSGEVNSSGSDSLLSKHPDDFDMYNIGTYDDSTGAVEPCEPVLVVRAKDLVKKV